MKKPMLAVIIGLVVGGISFGGYLAWSRSKASTPPQIVIETSQNTGEMQVWNDPNGFTFEYPDGLSINKHEEDEVNYAHIEFTHPDHPGNVIVWGRDTTAADVSAWVKTEKRFADASTLDTTLSGMDAKKILLTDPRKMIIVGTVDDGIIWTVEADLEDNEFWTNVHTTIADSFTLVPLGSNLGNENDSGAAAPATEEVFADEEEVLE